MTKVLYKSYNQNDNLLFPHCTGDSIPENDPIRVLDAIVERYGMQSPTVCADSGYGSEMNYEYMA